MFEQALQIIAQVSATDRNPLIARLYKVRTVSRNFGYGVGIDMDSLLSKYARKRPASSPSEAAGPGHQGGTRAHLVP